MIAAVPIQLDRAHADALRRLAEEAGISAGQAARRLVLAGMHMFSGFASDVGFKMAMEIEVVGSLLNPSSEVSISAQGLPGVASGQGSALVPGSIPGPLHTCRSGGEGEES